MGKKSIKIGIKSLSLLVKISILKFKGLYGTDIVRESLEYYQYWFMFIKYDQKVIWKHDLEQLNVCIISQ
jgi:hypothetical protein